MTSLDLDPVVKNYGHGIFKDCEGKGAEKQHDQQSYETNYMPMCKEYLHLFRHLR